LREISFRLIAYDPIKQATARKTGNAHALPIKLDHSVIHVSDWERSKPSIATCWGRAGAAAIGMCYRFRRHPAQPARPGLHTCRGGAGAVQPGNSDLCFEWKGPIADAIAHLDRCKVAIHCGPVERFGAKGPGTSVYFRDPDGSLLEFISYGGQAMTSTPRSDRAADRHPGAAGRRAARHLAGLKLPRHRFRQPMAGVDLSKLKGLTVVYIYPRTACRASPHPTAGTRSRARGVHSAVLLVPRPFCPS